jgi:hypothetical protein
MEDLNYLHAHLQDLKHQAKRLTSSALSLVALFDEEANRLNRKDEALRLKELHSSINQRLHQLKRGDDLASQAYDQVNLIFSLGGLAVGSAIKMVSKNKQLRTISGQLLKNLGNKRLPFGTVLVRIGPGGLPGDLGVVSVSQLARELNRQESEVINAFQERGYLLFDEREFSLLIDNLIADALEGRLHMPVAKEKLTEVIASGHLELRAEKSE